MRLTCQECKVVADEDALGWRALLAVDPDDAFEEPLLAFYCPVCADKEFGPSRRTGSGQTGLRYPGSPRPPGRRRQR